MNLEMVIEAINRQERIPFHERDGETSGPGFDETALEEWKKVVDEFKRLDGHCVGDHLCTWTEPNRFSLGSRSVLFRYPIIETATSSRRGLLSFCQSADLKPPISAVWAAPMISFHRTFCFKVWGSGLEVTFMQTPVLAGFILSRLHANEIAAAKAKSV